MDDATLARLEHENMTSTIRLAGAQVPGSLVRQAGGVALVLTGMPPRLFNQVIVSGGAVEPGAIEDAVAVARERGDRFVVNLQRGTDDGHVPVLERLGLVPFPDNPWLPGMALHPLPPVGGTPAPDGHVIRPVTDTAGLVDHIRTAADGFGMPVEWMEAVETEALMRAPGAVLYVGYTDGVPVSTGLAVRSDRTMGVYTIGTLEGARGRGYGAAMTMRIVDDGTAAGCDVAILQASDMGKPIYERLGFRTVVEYMGYVDPETLPPPDAA